MRKKVSLTLPVEFLELCKSDNIEPGEVLRDLIADLCGLETREYCNGGSDERDYAKAWYERRGYPWQCGARYDLIAQLEGER